MNAFMRFSRYNGLCLADCTRKQNPITLYVTRTPQSTRYPSCSFVLSWLKHGSWIICSNKSIMQRVLIDSFPKSCSTWKYIYKPPKHLWARYYKFYAVPAVEAYPPSNKPGRLGKLVLEIYQSNYLCIKYLVIPQQLNSLQPHSSQEQCTKGSLKGQVGQLVLLASIQAAMQISPKLVWKYWQ